MGRGMDIAMTAALRGTILLRRSCIGVQDKKVDLFVYRRAHSLCFKRNQCGWCIMADRLRRKICLNCGKPMIPRSNGSTVWWICLPCGLQHEVNLSGQHGYKIGLGKWYWVPEGCLAIVSQKEL